MMLRPEYSRLCRQWYGRLAVNVAVQLPDLHGHDVAEIAFGNQPPDGGISVECCAAGDDLGHELGRFPGRRQHHFRFRQVHRHPRLGQHVFAGSERCQRDRTVQIGPGANHDGVEIIGLDHLAPMVTHPRDAVVPGYPLRRFAPAIGNRDQLHPVLCQQAGDVLAARVVSGPDETQS